MAAPAFRPVSRTGHEGSLKKRRKVDPNPAKRYRRARASNERLWWRLTRSFWRDWHFPAWLRHRVFSLRRRLLVHTKFERRTKLRGQPIRSDPILAVQILGWCDWCGRSARDCRVILLFRSCDKVWKSIAIRLWPSPAVPATPGKNGRACSNIHFNIFGEPAPDMSVDGKVRRYPALALQFRIRDAGFGVVVPIFATYDSHPNPRHALFYVPWERNWMLPTTPQRDRGLPQCAAFSITKIIGARAAPKVG